MKKFGIYYLKNFRRVAVVEAPNEEEALAKFRFNTPGSALPENRIQASKLGVMEEAAYEQRKLVDAKLRELMELQKEALLDQDYETATAIETRINRLCGM